MRRRNVKKEKQYIEFLKQQELPRGGMAQPKAESKGEGAMTDVPKVKKIRQRTTESRRDKKAQRAREIRERKAPRVVKRAEIQSEPHAPVYCTNPF